MKKYIFILCLATSLFLHALFLTIMPCYAPLKQPVSKKKTIEISYNGLNQKQPTNNQKETKKKITPETDNIKPQQRSLPKPNTMEAFIKNQISKSKEALQIVKNPFTKKEERLVKKTVNLPDIPGEVFKSPDYKNYYHIVREKIRKLAYQNYKQLQEGEVVIAFCLNPEGILLEAEVNDKKSVNSGYLREIALRSVKNASPYPEFPPKLRGQKKLSFNVIISFELK